MLRNLSISLRSRLAFTRRQEPTLRNFRPREGNTRTDRLNFRFSIPTDSRTFVPAAARSRARKPASAKRSAASQASSPTPVDLAGALSAFLAAGRYRVRVKGYTIWVSGGGIDHWNFTGFGPEKVGYLYQPTYHRPNPDEVWPGRRDEPIGVYAQSSGQSRPLGGFRFYARSFRSGSGSPPDPKRFDPDRRDAPLPNPVSTGAKKSMSTRWLKRTACRVSRSSGSK